MENSAVNAEQKWRIKMAGISVIIMLPLMIIGMVFFTAPFAIVWGLAGAIAFVCFGGALALLITYMVLLRKGIFLKYEESEVKWQKSLTKFGKGIMIIGMIVLALSGTLDLVLAGRLTTYIRMMMALMY